MGITIQEAIEKAKSRKKGAFIPYFIMGYPNIEMSYQLIKESAPYADIIELGIPFSDPVADGPTIQKGVNIALKQNLSMDQLFKVSERLTSEIPKPFVMMIYFNQIVAYGLENFAEKLKQSGIQGIIVPDLLPDSEPAFNRLLLECEIDLIFLITPATVPKRIPQIIKACHGFLYFVSVIGITGQRTEVNKEIQVMIEDIKTRTDLPVCVGFGISQKEHVRSVVQYADGAIVGSAIVQRITDHMDSPDLSEQVIQMIQDLSSVLSNGDDK